MKLVCLVASFALCTLGWSHVQSDDLPDTPKNHWVYEAISDLKSTGLLVGYPDGLGPGIPNRSRYEFAVAVNAACTRLKNITQQLVETSDRLSQGQGAAGGDLKALQEDRDALSKDVRFLRKSMARQSEELLRLITTLAPQLKELGLSPSEMKAEVLRDLRVIESLRLPTIGASAKQFVDVPANHWAADAVANLRLPGILHGYPDGLFRGKS